MSAPFVNTIQSIQTAPPGFRVDVSHNEIPRGGSSKVVERHKFGIVAWAVVIDDKGRTDIEPVFLHNGRPTTASQYRLMYSDVQPAPGEPKLTVSIRVAEPVGYVAL